MTKRTVWMIGGCLGLTLAGAAVAGGSEGLQGALARFLVGPKVVVNNSFISPLTEVFGDISIGHGSFVAGNTVLNAQPGERICIGSETNLQDNITLVAIRGASTPAGGCASRSTTIKDRVSIAHQATIRNSVVGNFTFVGFLSVVENSVLEDGAFVLHGAQVSNVRIPVTAWSRMERGLPRRPRPTPCPSKPRPARNSRKRSWRSMRNSPRVMPSCTAPRASTL